MDLNHRAYASKQSGGEERVRTRGGSTYSEEGDAEVCSMMHDA